MCHKKSKFHSKRGREGPYKNISAFSHITTSKKVQKHVRRFLMVQGNWLAAAAEVQILNKKSYSKSIEVTAASSWTLLSGVTAKKKLMTAQISETTVHFWSCQDLGQRFGFGFGYDGFSIEPFFKRPSVIRDFTGWCCSWVNCVRVDKIDYNTIQVVLLVTNVTNNVCF